MRRAGLVVLTGIVLAALGVLAMAGPLSDPVRWTPDGLFYQARGLELQGVERESALSRTFQGALGAELRSRDPERSGDPAWVSYNAQFYERRVALPLAANALEPVAGERALLDLSVAGYVAAVLAVFWLLLLRFRLPIAAVATGATIFLPALTFHAGFPLTDSWGLALETAAFAAGILVLDRGPRWLPAWIAAILVLSFTRDSAWIPIAAAAWVALTQRSKVSVQLLVSGVAATIPVLLLFSMPTRELLAMMFNDIQPAPDASWGFIAERYPGTLFDFIQADGGFIRRGEWYSAFYLVGGVALLFLLTRGTRGDAAISLLKPGAAVALLTILALPIFSAFRLELVCVPMAAFGLAVGLDWLAERSPAFSRKFQIRTSRPQRASAG